MRQQIALLLIAALTLGGCTMVMKATNEGPIEQSPKERSWGAWWDDNTIVRVADVNISKADPGFDDSHIVLVSYNGMLLLTGQVNNERLKNLAEETARRVQKVRKVYNELEIAGPTTALVRSSDSWLTSKIRSQMLTTDNFPASRIKVTTENGVVYLMGIVTPEEAKMAVNLVSSSYGVQKIVKLFEYVQ